MTQIFLTQKEADHLLYAVKKQRIDDTEYQFPDLGGSLTVPLISIDLKQEFLLDISKTSINLSKGKYQTRTHKVIILARLDFGGSPHRNPDDKDIPCPHLHLYKEGFADKWAFPIPIDKFHNLSDLWVTLQDFMKFCEIIKPPNINLTLFSIT